MSNWVTMIRRGNQLYCAKAHSKGTYSAAYPAYNITQAIPLFGVDITKKDHNEWKLIRS